MKTLNELQHLAAEGKLDEIDTLAALAQGWEYVNQMIEVPSYIKDGKVMFFKYAYHPTRDKAQAVDLMLKAELSPVISNGQVYFIGFRGLPYFPKEDFTKAVTIAFILAKQGEE